METLRDTAFGKLVRLATHYRWMQYPEEQDLAVWPEYLKTEHRGKEGDPAVPAIDNENPEDLEAFGLYTVMSQASRRISAASMIRDGSADSSRGNQTMVISWRGPDDPEVGICSWED